MLIANLDPTLERTPPPDDLRAVLERFPEGLVTQEVAAIMATGNAPPDRLAAEAALLELGARRAPLGDDALWSPTPVPAAA